MLVGRAAARSIVLVSRHHCAHFYSSQGAARGHHVRGNSPIVVLLRVAPTRSAGGARLRREGGPRKQGAERPLSRAGAQARASQAACQFSARLATAWKLDVPHADVWRGRPLYGRVARNHPSEPVGASAASVEPVLARWASKQNHAVPSGTRLSSGSFGRAEVPTNARIQVPRLNGFPWHGAGTQIGQLAAMPSPPLGRTRGESWQIERPRLSLSSKDPRQIRLRGP